RGPYDLLIEGGTIRDVRRHRPDAEIPADRVIDATGRYVMPGIVDLHGHIMFSRGGEPFPKDYV
ncbi:MAG: amidohydrolase, partial [Gammaproteobacteria bacterium]|nr:amidohydrolase [Gemmatimonadota bacterium]NIU74021.1 amidohydrolase [Gammaproteobacteria bacterium]